MDNKTIKEKLVHISENSADNPLKKHVAEYVLENYQEEEIKIFFKDIQHGCASGMISHLIYYHDTAKFFDEFYEDIENLRIEWEESTGDPLKIEGDLKNFLAWFGFERMADIISNEIRLDL